MTTDRTPGSGREPDWDRAAERARQKARVPHRTEHDPIDGVVAVFRSAAEAERAAAAVTAAVPGVTVRVGDDASHVAALRAEMAEEDARSFAGPSVGLYTPEMAKGAAWGTAVWAVVGAILAAPFSLIPMGDLVIAVKLMIVTIVGAVAGGAFGFVAGGGAAAKSPAEPMAAEAGVSLGVAVAGPDERKQVVRVLSAAEPVRLDEVRRGRPEATVERRRHA
ncbi:MAG TPA: hypothetical protein VM841_12030 [Actinomycetota bacterium]|nr:hypothetical protein [Actinomycetota bacterium]